MESQNTFINSSSNQVNQMQSLKRPIAASSVNVFESVSSKKDLHDHMQNHLQYYMPPREMFTKDFAKEIFSGKKKLLKLHEVKMISVVRYNELSVKNLYNKFLTLDHFVDYVPSKYAKGRQCDRDYMFCIANTLHEDIVKQLVEHALKVRHAVDADDMQAETILVNDHWKDELTQLPLVSRKKGKMIALLKQKSKVIIQRKETKKHDLADVFGKRRKVEQEIAQSQMQPQASSVVQNRGKTIKATVVEKFDINMSNQETKR